MAGQEGMGEQGGAQENFGGKYPKREISRMPSATNCTGVFELLLTGVAIYGAAGHETPAI